MTIGAAGRRSETLLLERFICIADVIAKNEDRQNKGLVDDRTAVIKCIRDSGWRLSGLLTNEEYNWARILCKFWFINSQ